MHKFSAYIPVYKYTENAGHDGSFGVTMYLSLDELYAYEPLAIGHFEVSGQVGRPIECGAV